jgi:FkbM family methyltransferase
METFPQVQSSRANDAQLETVRKCRDLIYDVGLHKGEDSEFYLRKGFRVVAFEADPVLCQLCKLRLDTFIKTGQLVIIEGAIHPDPAIVGGKVRFYKNCDNTVWGTIESNWAERNSRLGASSAVIEVSAIDFAQVIREFGMPYYMKIDIEGCDMVCIRTLKMFDARPEFISIESDKTHYAKIESEISTLADLGYNVFKAIEQSAIPELKSSPNRPKEGKNIPYDFPEGSSGPFGLELDGPWLAKHKVLKRYRIIMLGYNLLGDDGIIKHWQFRGSGFLKRVVARILRSFTKAAVPGWYDTHARHGSALAPHT